LPQKQTGSIAARKRRGKSGQHRASRFLTGRVRLTNTASATENIPPSLEGKGENVR